MKIGILTLPLHTNYGGVLQAYALQVIMQRMGHDVIVFNRERFLHQNILRRYVSFLLYIIRKRLIGRNNYYINPLSYNRELFERERYVMDFINKYIQTHTINSFETDVPMDLDAIIVGSDQVWRKPYFTRMYNTKIENAFLRFVRYKPIKKVSYAASFGTDQWEFTENETKECAELLRLFDAVSVREKSAIALCESKLKRTDALCLVDPTLLLTKEDYVELVETSTTNESAGNLLCYVLDNNDNKQSLINRIAKERNLTPFYSNHKINDACAPQVDRIQPPVEQWIRGFMDAEFVVTDSFHACVFSIIFGKPFIAVGNKERGVARFESLLSLFSLENNLICDTNEYDNSVSYEINTTQINSVLEEERKKSLLFLRQFLP